VVPQLSNGWQHNYATKTKPAAHANEQSMYSLVSKIFTTNHRSEETGRAKCRTRRFFRSLIKTAEFYLAHRIFIGKVGRGTFPKRGQRDGSGARPPHQERRVGTGGGDGRVGGGRGGGKVVRGGGGQVQASVQVMLRVNKK